MLTDSQAAQLFQAFAGQPDLFALKREAFRKGAIDVLVAQLKHKDCGLDLARKIVAAVGSEPLLAVFDEQPSATIAALVGKFDKASTTRAKTEGGWARAHLAALVEGRVEPEPSSKAKRMAAPKAKKSKEPVVRALQQARSMGGG